MPIQVRRLPNEPIVVVSFEAPMDFRVEVPPMLQAILEARDTITDPVPRYFVIMDFSQYTLTFTDLIYAMGELKSIRELRRADRPALLMIVGIGGVIEMGAKALSQAQYGSYQSRLFDTLDEALEASRKLAESDRA